MKGSETVPLCRADGGDSPADARLSWTLTETATLLVSIDGLGELSSSESDLFECLVSVRRRLEPLGIRICCNGARRDAYPSRMNRDMGGGLKVQVRRMGRPTTLNDVKDTFAPADASDIGTVEEQETYYGDWLRVLRSLA
ncbi:hypothetical protein ACWEBX_26350 [Streptomyces sp. NPDC005070]